ncbi:MAG: TIR domain-containing protein [Candidatus Magnetobacterium sp. LHC-1]|nr:TIR domain-containing protein [Nitrospirota bacterium]
MNEDRPIVEEIALRLKHEYGLNVWFDRWAIVAGTDVQQAMSDGLKESKTYAIFFGKSSPEGWCQQEMRVAVGRGTKDASFRVIPVFLPNADTDNIYDIDNFLKSRAWIDFSKGVYSGDEMYRLVCGIQGKSPDTSPVVFVRPKLINKDIPDKNMYSVFFSYSADCLELTEKVVNYLADNDVDIWFDKLNSIHNDDRRLVVVEALSNSYSVTVVVGPGYKDDIFFNNIIQDIEKHIKEKPYIKLMLILFNGMKISDVPSFLQSCNYINLHSASDVVDALSQKRHELYKMIVLKDKITSCDAFQCSEHYMELIQCYDDVINYAVDIYGYENPIKLDLLKRLGKYLKSIGQFKKSINSFERAIRICVDKYGAFHAKMAELKHITGLVWFDLREYDKAFECLYIALYIDKNIFGEKHANVAREYNSIGSIWYELGQKKEALALFEYALEINTAIYGENHPDVGIDYSNIGSAWDELREKCKALEFYEKALNILETFYGIDHPHTKIVRDNIAKLKP